MHRFHRIAGDPSDKYRQGETKQAWKLAFLICIDKNIYESIKKLQRIF